MDSNSFGEVGFTRGKLLKETLYDSFDDKVQSEELTYEELDRRFYVLSTTATTASYAWGGTVANFQMGAFFPIYYPKFNVVKRILTHYTRTDSIQEVTEYEYEYVEKPSDELGSTRRSDSRNDEHPRLNYVYNCRKLISEKSARMKHGCVLAESEQQYAYPIATEAYFADAFYYPVRTTKSFIQNTCIGESETKFKTIQVNNKNVIVPSQVIQTSDNKSRVVTEFLDYDKNTGMLLKYKELGKPVTTLQWDKSVFNRLVSKMNDVTSLQYSYNADGLLEYITFEDGQRKKYEYDAFGRLTTVSNVVDREKKPLQSFEYNYKNK